MPTSAWASAGASLTPSPTIATLRPCGLQLGDLGRLVGRQHLGEHLVDADLGARSARRSRGCRRSASRGGRRAPSARRPPRRPSRVARRRSRSAPAARPSIGDLNDRASLARELVGALARGRRARRPRARAGARCRSRRAGPSTVAIAPWPGTASNDSARGGSRPRVLGRLDDRLGERVLALALDRRRRAAAARPRRRRRRSRSRRPRARRGSACRSCRARPCRAWRPARSPSRS